MSELKFIFLDFFFVLILVQAHRHTSYNFQIKIPPSFSWRSILSIHTQKLYITEKILVDSHHKRNQQYLNRVIMNCSEHSFLNPSFYFNQKKKTSAHKWPLTSPHIYIIFPPFYYYLSNFKYNYPFRLKDVPLEILRLTYTKGLNCKKVWFSSCCGGKN